ncbi:hypothetical protein MITS9509_00346 [Synechococcus sp. MIT S9509]|uniref:hypothetical protein n=1 Tax=Synechococcus sp. MIT S9509 TaxID=1801630 RepID=UPI0007BB84F2|nr:hypothetical protein [Synechococcus sp. MIT S9509]KZR93751.1 hypothetical protein MITS9509_00346 [Synechococcus sp. MIT S9509]
MITKNLLIRTSSRALSTFVSIGSLYVYINEFLPSDIGAFAIFSSAASIISAITLRNYPVLLLSSSSLNQEKQLYRDTFKWWLSISVLAIAASVLFKISEISLLIYPLSAFMGGALVLDRFLDIRAQLREKIYLVSLSYLANSLVSLLATLALINFTENHTFWTLCFGKIIGVLASISVMSTGVFSEYSFDKQSKSESIAQISSHHDKKIASITSVLNVVFNYFTPFVVVYSFGTSVLGQFSIAQRLIGIPISLSSIIIADEMQKLHFKSQKQNQDVDSPYRSNGNRDNSTLMKKRQYKLFLISLILGALIAVVMLIDLPNYFVGNSWSDIGTLVLIMIPLMISQLSTSSCYRMLQVSNQYSYLLKWELSRVIFVFLFILLSSYLVEFMPATYLVSASYSITGFVLYLILYRHYKKHFFEANFVN